MVVSLVVAVRLQLWDAHKSPILNNPAWKRFSPFMAHSLFHSNSLSDAGVWLAHRNVLGVSPPQLTSPIPLVSSKHHHFSGSIVATAITDVHFAWMLGLLTFCQLMGFPLNHYKFNFSQGSSRGAESNREQIAAAGWAGAKPEASASTPRAPPAARRDATTPERSPARLARVARERSRICRWCRNGRSCECRSRKWTWRLGKRGVQIKPLFGSVCFWVGGGGRKANREGCSISVCPEFGNHSERNASGLPSM